MKFFEKLEARIKAADTLLCVGIDPHSSDLKEQTAEELIAFSTKLIQSTHEYVCCYKPNSAFFEAIPGGMEALKQVSCRFLENSFLSTRPSSQLLGHHSQHVDPGECAFLLHLKC